MKRRIFTMIIMALMLMTFIPAAAFAEGEEPEGPAVPVSAEWDSISGYDLRGVIGTDELTNLDTPDVAAFLVKYSDGSEKTFIYREYTYEEGTQGEYTDSGFFADEEDPEKESSRALVEVNSEASPVEFKEGKNTAEMLVRVPYVVSGAGTDDEEIEYKDLTCEVTVLCAIEKPLKVEFVPAKGFAPELGIGINYVTTESFYGEGNKFVITRQVIEAGNEDYTEITESYIYTKGTDMSGDEVEGFYWRGKVDLTRFDIEPAEVSLVKGMNTIDLEYTEYLDVLDDEVTVQFQADIDVQKYTAFSDYRIYPYTGKVIKPNIKLHDSELNVISKDKYTYEMPANKKMGWYQVDVTFKDEYKDDYFGPVSVSYGIGPKAPAIKKLVPGKKKLTVKWKKLSKAALKNVDSYMIEVALDKNFSKGYKSVTVSKKGIKKYSKAITKLKKGKKYYVTITAFKKITQDGVKYEMPSEPSKVKAAKVK